MHILFITDEFYPEFGANSLIVKTVADQMTSKGVTVSVAPLCYDGCQAAEEVWNNIDIIRCVESYTFRGLKKHLRSGNIGSSFSVMLRYARMKVSKHEALWMKDRIFARKEIDRIIHEKKIDAVISINCSVELSFPLLWLREHDRLPCKWFFYMLDPFESHMYYRQHYSVSELRKWQHRIMAACDGTFATQIICEEVEGWEDKSVINKLCSLEFPKIEEPRHIPCEDDINMPTDKINIVCTGSRNEEVRNSEFALKTCGSIADDKFLFHFVGIGWTGKDFQKEGNAIFYKPRSWQAVRNMQMKADFLLNIGNKISNQLPSKVLEYISTGNPIINFYKVEYCPTLALLKDYDALNIYENDLNNAIQKMSEFMYSSHGKASFVQIKECYREYTPEFVAAKMLENIHGA